VLPCPHYFFGLDEVHGDVFRRCRAGAHCSYSPAARIFILNMSETQRRVVAAHVESESKV